MIHRIIPFAIILITSIQYVDAQNNIVKEVQNKMEQLYATLNQRHSPGGCVMLKKGKEIIFEKCGGLEDMVSKTPITSSTIFNTGSISKTVVANGILILEEQGKLSIEDPLSKHFTDFENPEVIQNIKIKHLLAHNSGLPDARNVSNNRDHYLTAKDRGNWDPLKKINKLNFNPGERFQYSNPAFNGLALIIENVSGQPWQDFVQAHIFDPSGMTRSKITNGSYPSDDVAHGYDFRNEKWVENDYGEFPTFAAAGNGGVWCSIEDLIKYEEALQSNQFISSLSLEKSRTVFHPENWQSGDNPHIGIGWFIDENSYEDKITYHTGSQGGFRAFHYAIPTKEITYVALFNYPPSEYRAFINEGLGVLKDVAWIR